jgi:hypothetical protein
VSAQKKKKKKKKKKIKKAKKFKKKIKNRPRFMILKHDVYMELIRVLQFAF